MIRIEAVNHVKDCGKFSVQQNHVRIKSKYFGKHSSLILSDKNNKQIFVPPGFAHGFITLKDNTIFTYKCTEAYDKESEGSILWNDKDLNIDWGMEDPIVSGKDAESPTFAKLSTQF